MKTYNTLLTALGLTIALATLSSSLSVSQFAQADLSRSAIAATVNSNPWQAILGSTTTLNRWRVKPCEGTAPFLCATFNHKTLGSVELQTYSLAQHPAFQKMLTKVGIPVGTTDYRSIARQTQLKRALQMWVNDYYAVISKDRRAVYGNGGAFVTSKPQTAKVGQLQGLQYGFSGRDRTGKIREQQIGYVAFDGKKLYVITTAYDVSGLPGGFKSLRDLQQFEPLLTRTVSGLKLAASK